MRLLLDTNALLDMFAQSSRLGPHRRAAIADPANEVWVSSISLAELAIKVSIGKLTMPTSGSIPFPEIAERLGCVNLPFLPEHAERMRTLPLHHRDPFDRMIIAQALVEDLVVMTTDRQFAAYGVRLVEA